jgi:integrase
LTLGELPLAEIRTSDVEALRDWRKAEGLSAYTVNHDLKLLRKMFNWAVRHGYLERTPFKIGTEPAVGLEKEIPRARRFDSDEEEQKVLDSSDPYLRAVIVALLDTACRVGEILSLQWADVNLARREVTIQAAKAKTRTSRLIPLSSRLLAVLELRKYDPAGKPFGAEAYVFGNEQGDPVAAATVRAAWGRTVRAAGLRDHLQLRDLRHEAGSRFDEAGVSVNYVSKILGHASLSTTTRYLNIRRRGLHLAMEKLEESRRRMEERKGEPPDQKQAAESVAQPLHTDETAAQAFVRDPETNPARKPLVS